MIDISQTAPSNELSWTPIMTWISILTLFDLLMRIAFCSVSEHNTHVLFLPEFKDQCFLVRVSAQAKQTKFTRIVNHICDSESNSTKAVLSNTKSNDALAATMYCDRDWSRCAYGCPKLEFRASQHDRGLRSVRTFQRSFRRYCTSSMGITYRVWSFIAYLCLAHRICDVNAGTSPDEDVIFHRGMPESQFLLSCWMP